MLNRIPKKLRNIFSDTVWSAAGLVLMNAVAQLVVYPSWYRILGSEIYGNIVYQLGIMNTLSISAGCAVNYARMRRSVEGKTDNKPYLLLMFAGTVLVLLVLFLIYCLTVLKADRTEYLLFCVLTIATMWRYYVDVEYRLHIDYKGYFVFYLVISIGYLFGILLFRICSSWPISLLPGELAGILWVYVRGSVLKKATCNSDIIRESISLLEISRLVLILFGANVLSQLVFNGDRIVLQLLVSSSAVSIYYIASLFGKTMTFITTPLNGVLIGHLSKYNGCLTKRMMNSITAFTFFAIIAGSMACIIAANLVLPFLYPNDFHAVRHYIPLVNLAQVVFFVGNVLVSSVILRFTNPRNQLLLNIVNSVLFVFLCVPSAKLCGLQGFCWCILATNSIRLIICLIFGYRETRISK